VDSTTTARRPSQGQSPLIKEWITIQITRLLQVLTGLLRLSLLAYGSFTAFVAFLRVSFRALPLPSLLPLTKLSFARTLAYLFHCLDDRAL
jgi:hypothetical protein